MLEATTQNNTLETSAFLFPEKDRLSPKARKVIGTPQQRECPTVIGNTVLMSPPRIGHPHEQVVPEEAISYRGNNKRKPEWLTKRTFFKK